MPATPALYATNRPHLRDRWREWRLVFYASGNLGKNLALGGVDLTLLFLLTDLLGVSAGVAGTLMAWVFLGDLLFDIAAGVLAARARARGIGYGRIMVAGAVPCSLAFAAIYGFAWAGLHDLWVLGLILLVFRAACAIIDVPHNSLMASVAPDSRARGRTAGYRTLFTTLASLAVAGLLTPSVLRATHGGATSTLALLGLAGAALIMASLWIAARAARPADEPAPGDRAPTVWLPRLDGPTMGMVAIGMLTGFALPMFGRMAIYLATYVYGHGAMAEPLLLALTLGQLAGVALWTWAVRLADKNRLLMASYVLTMVALLLLMLTGGREELSIGLSAVLGMGLAGACMFPWGLMADVIDIAEFRHGERREAAMVALVMVTAKASAAASTSAIGWTLARLGYVAGAAQGPSVKLAIEGMALGLPLAGSVLAMLILSRMGPGEGRQDTILRALARRRNRAQALADASMRSPLHRPRPRKMGLRKVGGLLQPRARRQRLRTGREA